MWVFSVRGHAIVLETQMDGTRRPRIGSLGCIIREWLFLGEWGSRTLNGALTLDITVSGRAPQPEMLNLETRYII